MLKSEANSLNTAKQGMSGELQKLRNELLLVKEEAKESGDSEGLKQQLEQAQAEVLNYKRQTDSLAAQLSRAQAKIRTGSRGSWSLL